MPEMSDDQIIELKPCPFCGGKAPDSRQGVDPAVWCSECIDEDGVVEPDKWNTRPSDLKPLDEEAVCELLIKHPAIMASSNVANKKRMYRKVAAAIVQHFARPAVSVEWPERLEHLTSCPYWTNNIDNTCTCGASEHNVCRDACIQAYEKAMKGQSDE